MGGKVSLFLVIGFSSLFAIIGRELLTFSNDSTENLMGYFNGTHAHNIAVSGANMAANQLFLNRYWLTGYNNLPVDDGLLNVTVDTFNVDERIITSIGEYKGFEDTVIVKLEPKNFAQYGNFYNTMAAWAATGDTFQGPFHTNDYLKCYGVPVFMGYTTTKKGVKLYNKYAHPEFHGGLESGVYIPLEFDTSIIRQAAYDNGKIFRDTTGTNKILDIKMKFIDDGTLTYSYKIDSGVWSDSVNIPINTLAPNGVIYVEKGNIWVEGTVNGRVSIVATRKGSSSAGKIHITDDLRYNQNPLTDPTSTDMMGIIAEQNVQVDYNEETGDLDLHGSIYSQKDGLVIENYQNYPGPRLMNLVGGIIGDKVRATATYKWDGTKYIVTHGYSYVHKFDTRFYKTVPPYFPKTKYFKVVSWLE